MAPHPWQTSVTPFALPICWLKPYYPVSVTHSASAYIVKGLGPPPDIVLRSFRLLSFFLQNRVTLPAISGVGRLLLARQVCQVGVAPEVTGLGCDQMVKVG